MVVGHLPFDAPNFKLLSSRIRKAKVNFPQDLSTDLKHLIIRMLDPKPEDRASLFEIIQHPWINKNHDKRPVNWSSLLVNIVLR
ncbi:serine/threonine-protein kinase KIN2 [Nowakowskiella sp. JEL0078]|nr:serine/threonine-protein kinase KIN2 [Nowakowskiella sp. JEL0078]